MRNPNDENIDGKHSINDIEIEEHLRDEFKDDLVNMMNIEYEKEDTVNGVFKIIKKISKLSFFRRFVIVFSLLIIVSGITFGKNFTSFVSHIFSNQDKSVELAVDNGYYQNVNIDYINHDGIGIKVDYIYSDETCVYIAFNIQTEEEFKWIYLQDMTLINEKNETIYSITESRVIYQPILKKISKTNAIVLAKFYSINQEFVNYSNLNINISQVVLVIDDNNEKSVTDNWNFKLDVENPKLAPEKLYLVDSEKMIKNYNIKMKNYRLSIDMEFTYPLMENLNIDRNNTCIIDEEGNYHYCNDFYSFNNYRIKMDFPINNLDNKNIKLIFKNDEKILTFYLYRKDG